jgi:hypothetical protein
MKVLAVIESAATLSLRCCTTIHDEQDQEYNTFSRKTLVIGTMWVYRDRYLITLRKSLSTAAEFERLKVLPQCHFQYNEISCNEQDQESYLLNISKHFVFSLVKSEDTEALFALSL